MRLQWSARAAGRFDEIFDYVAQWDVAAADRLLERVAATAEALTRRPIGRPGPVPGTYVKRVLRTRYLIVYRLESISGEQVVRVLDVVHTAQNWTAAERP